MQNSSIPPRLRWACRRGMLELDVLLGQFLEEVYPSLTESDQNLFVQLLSESDQDLFMWLSGQQIAENQAIAKMVEKIRQHAEHRHHS